MNNEIDIWTKEMSLNHLPDDWVIGFRLSTVPIEYWLYKRNSLKDDAIKLDITLNYSGTWVATLERHDDLFKVQWRPNNLLHIESQQLKYRKLVKWPVLEKLNAFPEFVIDLEKVLNINFIRHVDISSRLIQNQDLVKNKNIQQWLSVCSDTCGELMQS